MKRVSYVVFIVSTVIVLDQLTKQLVVTYLSPFDSIRIFPFLHIVNVSNTGAAFGTFRNLGSNFFIAVSVAAILSVIFLLKRRTYHTLGLSLVLGGAIGNLIDRLFHGMVVDFIDFFIGRFHWPAFNVADSALTIGITIILLTSLLKK